MITLSKKEVILILYFASTGISSDDVVKMFRLGKFSIAPEKTKMQQLENRILQAELQQRIQIEETRQRIIHRHVVSMIIKSSNELQAPADPSTTTNMR